MADTNRDPHLWRSVSALGVAQIISWGSLFYTIAVLGGAMREELGVSDVLLFGSFTAGLFLSGMVSPVVGRQIDTRGGRRVLAAGSLLGAVASIALATCQGPLTMLAGWLLAGAAMGACLYDPAFATLHQISGTSYRRAVTALTLFGGFASTVFWPLSQYLLDVVGWRYTFAVYAGLHLFVCLPLHLLLVPKVTPHAMAHETPHETGAAPVRRRRSLRVARHGVVARGVHGHGHRRAPHRPAHGDGPVCA